MNFDETFRRTKGDDKMNHQIEQLYDELEKSSFTVAITGAGISIAAGGVTFAGMFSKGGRPGWISSDPDQIYWSYYDTFLRPTFEHGPTKAHLALAELEKAGELQGIITTNGDCIHTVAGSKNVAEIQGSFQVNVCTGCGQWNYDYNIWNKGKMPTCPNCGEMIETVQQLQPHRSLRAGAEAGTGVDTQGRSDPDHRLHGMLYQHLLGRSETRGKDHPDQSRPDLL